MSEARALSIRQPWVHLILQGRKQIELRTWRTTYRGPLWLHAGKQADTEMIEQLNLDETLFRGGYVGTAQLVSIVPLDAARWHAWQSLHLGGPYKPGYFGWVFSAPARFDEPIPAKGQLRLFQPDQEMQETLIAAWQGTRPRSV